MSMKAASIGAASSPAAELLPGSAASIGLLPGEVACEQAGNRAFRVGQVLPAALQGGLETGQLSVEIPAFDQALGREHPDGSLSCVLGHVMNVLELPVRRYPCAWRVRSAPDLGPEHFREASARESVRVWRRHRPSIAACLKTVLDVVMMPDYCLKTVGVVLRQRLPGLFRVGTAHNK